MASLSSSPSRHDAVSSAGSPDLSTFSSRICIEDDSKKQSQAKDDPGLGGWWFGVSKDGKDPYGHIIHISAEHGRYLARSYSPWQLATSKMGTPFFEIHGTSSEGDEKEQAIFLKHKAAPQDGEGRYSDHDMKLALRMFHLTPTFETSQDQWAETLMKLAASNGKKDANKEMFMELMSKHQINVKPTKAATNSGSVDIDCKDQTVIWIEFGVGSFKKKNTGKLEGELLRVPATLERKDCFSFCLTVEEDNDQHVDNILQAHRTIDHAIFDNIVECIGKGKSRKNEDALKFWPLIRSQQPSLSGLTTFNRIAVPASTDPLTGLYLCSNGYLVTEVIQFTHKFGQYEDGPSKIESYEYVEAVKLTGDPDVPAGEVVFRAKVGDTYKLPPGFVLEEKFGAVARYKGQGRLTGFQKSRWVDVEVFILGKEYLEHGFAIGFLYSVSKYHVLKLFKQLNLPSFQKSH